MYEEHRPLCRPLCGGPKIAILGLFLRLFYFSFYDLIDSWQVVV